LYILENTPQGRGEYPAMAFFGGGSEYEKGEEKPGKMSMKKGVRGQKKRN
jgi:hypothetical protein